MKTLVYINPDCYIDVDMSVLKHIAARFKVVWYAVYYTDRKIYYTPRELEEYASKYGIELHLCPRQYRQRNPRNLGFYRRIVKDILSCNPDLVYSCITEELWWTLAARRLGRVTTVLGLHDVVMHEFGAPVKRFIQTIIRKFTIRAFANVCVFSENQAALFRKIYGRSVGVLSLACRELGPSQIQAPPFETGTKLLFFGNIVEYKGLDLLISAIEELRSEGIMNISLTIAGRGEHWEACRPLIKTPEAYRLEIRFIANEELPDLLSSHHFLALPYRSATQSGPLALAAGYGIPIFAPDYGCFREQYDNRSAVLYSDLKDALRRIASMTTEEYALMKENAAALRETFSEEAVASRYVDYFNTLA